MTKTIALGLALLATIGATSAAAGPDHAATCRYFEGTAFNDRHTRAEPSFRVDLADDCTAALQEVTASRKGSVRYVLAQAYLDKLERYRRTLIDMASARFRAARSLREAPNANRPVSRTGAYLIAREMGIVANRVRWHEWHAAMAEGRILNVE